MNRLLSVASIFFCLEIGLFLIIIPWSELWESNYLLNYAPGLRPAVLHTSFRAGVTVLGVIDIFIGLSELRHLIRSMRAPSGIME
jgi:hypothetical protein